MDVLKKYSIAHKGLGMGAHRFEFEVDDRFFEAFEGSEIRKGSAKATVEMDKQSDRLSLRIGIRGEATVECDRCLDELTLPVEYDGTLCVRYGQTENESDGEVMWIGPGETEIPLAQYIYESICLSLPCQRVHPDDEHGRSTCDPDMLGRFRIVSEEEFDGMAASAERGASPWDKLKEIKTGE
ncbi:DUF177 domain-containing protein [uncultured Alistipes sp.]|uniref:YceD family protein n=1 Tax=uncultured Alistipes sp. TaxID=538949 RepID=UPI00260E7A41|nr:DUF177 domain-containing protein [uncultured Alistipes sp.]